MLTVGSLFAGIGGFDLGFERAGMEIRWQVEIDPFRRSVLARHWPDVPRYRDIRKIDLTELERVDVICGGFPCQPVSLAGERGGNNDERWLWPYFAEAIGVLLPRYVVVENVIGLASRGLGEVLAVLTACGYDAEWDVVSAETFGAPHLRERLFVVAYPHGFARDTQRRPSPKIFKQQEVERLTGCGSTSYWASRPLEPGVRYVAPRVPDRLVRLAAGGDAIVPQVAEFVGRLIVAAERSTNGVV